ncbi:histidinol-phosphate transaminase [Paracoccus sp. Z118]|uniref:histidinol-phosphate transaminase n=1 Tax=Paracoccus sp. Z118 TaxID=2851017 RepID=UPI001C2BF00C|nr:histidinol-phosphate transaminase [Paracoccus sp. Z118]MBV0891766.1 histidinol-phosphate transaminase [Paracoccus sp. Z118]
MSQTIQPQPGIMDIALYEAGSAHVAGVAEAVKLSSNENPFGPSPKARDAVIRAAHAMHRYPSTDHTALRQAIGKVHGLDPDRIICGVGSDEIIHFLCQAYAGPGTEVLFTEHGFLMYPISARAAGATPVTARERERTTDIDALIAAATPATRLIFVANPNNPTGTMVELAELERLARAVPQAILVIDAAYAEYAGDDYDGGAGLATDLPNVFMTRTFSKIYGLGGLRVGWGYGPREIIDVLNRIRGPFNLSSLALDGALAAMQDREHVERSRSENARLRAWLAAALAERGVPSDASHANFVLARFEGPETAGAADAALKAEGVIVRRVGGYGLPDCLRITIGDEASCRRVAHVLGRFMAERGTAAVGQRA